jgi:hypothetical protein
VAAEGKGRSELVKVTALESKDRAIYLVKAIVLICETLAFDLVCIPSIRTKRIYTLRVKEML